jgi:hypothetical protein
MKRQREESGRQLQPSQAQPQLKYLNTFIKQPGAGALLDARMFPDVKEISEVRPVLPMRRPQAR